MKKKILNWITANIGIIIIFMIVLIIFAPSFFSGNTFTWLETCFLFRNINFTQTGNIGDTIGGITAPFIGVLSIILLYITFREQREFNKTQRSANDWTVLLEMKNTIENHSKNVKFDLVFPRDMSPNKPYVGLENIESLNNTTNNQGQISLGDFNKLCELTVENQFL